MRLLFSLIFLYTIAGLEGHTNHVMIVAMHATPAATHYWEERPGTALVWAIQGMNDRNPATEDMDNILLQHPCPSNTMRWLCQFLVSYRYFDRGGWGSAKPLISHWCMGQSESIKIEDSRSRLGSRAF